MYSRNSQKGVESLSIAPQVALTPTQQYVLVKLPKGSRKQASSQASRRSLVRSRAKPLKLPKGSRKHSHTSRILTTLSPSLLKLPKGSRKSSMSCSCNFLAVSVHAGNSQKGVESQLRGVCCCRLFQ